MEVESESLGLSFVLFPHSLQKKSFRLIVVEERGVFYTDV